MKLNLKTYPEPTNSNYSMYNTGGVEVEVGEFLHGLVRMIKPEAILETGTHKGISTAYMASALKENGNGKITTVEYEFLHWKEANKMFTELGFGDWINSLCQDVNTLEIANNQFDLIFLDTEPHLRFSEFLRFWHGLRPGGLIGIHDLNSNMGQTGVEINKVMNWPFGTLPEEIKELMRTRQLSNFHFRTPRGFYLGQKGAGDFYEV